MLLIGEQHGPIAHLVERFTCTEEAGGSNPLWSTNCRAQMRMHLSPLQFATKEDSKDASRGPSGSGGKTVSEYCFTGREYLLELERSEQL